MKYRFILLAHLRIAQVSLCHGAEFVVRRPSSVVRCPFVRPSTFHIYNFYTKTAEGIYSKLATDVPYDVPNKSCYFSSRSKIEYGRSGL